jgi:hypothetical protein
MKLIVTPHGPGFGRLIRPRDDKDWNFPMAKGLRQLRLEDEPLPRSRRWRLERRRQVDQGNTPECVTHAGHHWGVSLPIYQAPALTPSEVYTEVKKDDPWPGQDGTDARSLMKVYQKFGIVESYWWYDGDDEALDRWLLLRGPVLFGAGWTDSMFQTLPSGLIEVIGNDFYAGHETVFIGFDRKTRRTEVVNSWGLDRWGIKGRGWLEYGDRRRLLDAQGDALGMIQKRAA